MYLAILTSSKTGMALSPAELREHPVMAHLVRTRQLWQESEALKPIEFKPAQLPTPPQEPAPVPAPQPNPKVRKVKQPSRTPEPLPKPRRREKKVKRTDTDILAAQISNPVEDESDFGDEAPLTQQEAAEKAKRKKSLRFYTSQIAQKANQRGAASRQAGGDDDVPHKERIRDRQERLTREAENRAREKADELGEQSDDDGGAVQRDGDGDYEYYDLLVSQSREKKSDKAARAEAYALAAKEGAQVFEQEVVGLDGKRKITYAIEKNKGLTPKRKKDVRNPRVKKRKKFDEKMKKLGSIRPVFKGGEGRGGYGGEATGIKTNVVKSVKL
jgi:U3 small nucleolar RNA-associated protein 3